MKNSAHAAGRAKRVGEVLGDRVAEGVGYRDDMYLTYNVLLTAMARVRQTIVIGDGLIVDEVSSELVS